MLFAGRLSRGEGHPRARRRRRDGLPLVVVGDGPLRDRVPGALGLRPARRARRLPTSAPPSSPCPSRREGYGVVARRGDGPRPAGGRDGGRRAARPGRRRRDRAARAARRRRGAARRARAAARRRRSAEAARRGRSRAHPASTSRGPRSPTRRSAPTRTRLPAERPAVVLGLLWAGLSFARSLGRRGVPVTGITMHPHEFGIALALPARRLARQGRRGGADGAASPTRGRRQAGAAAGARRPRRARAPPLGRAQRVVRAADARRPRRRAPAAAQGDAAAGGRARGRGRATHGRGGLARDASEPRPAPAVPAQAGRGPALRRVVRREGDRRPTTATALVACVEARARARFRHGRPGARPGLGGAGSGRCSPTSAAAAGRSRP